MRARHEVERQVRIAAPAAVVYLHVADLRRWSGWMPWEGVDPSIVRTHDGPASGVGARAAWTGGRVSTDVRVEVTAARPPSSVECSVVFSRPLRSRFTAAFRLVEEDDGATLVTWSMSAPSTAASRLLQARGTVDRVVGRGLDDGLWRLRGAVETEVEAARVASAPLPGQGRV